MLKSRNIYIKYIYTLRQAISQQQQQQASISAGKELTPAHQASIPQPPRAKLVPSSGAQLWDTGVTSQVNKNSLCLRYMKN